MTTWTPKTQQAEVWTAADVTTGVFDPAVFDNDPVFDTARRAGGAWVVKTKQAEVWTQR